MNPDILLFLLYLLALIGFSFPLGAYMADVYEGRIPKWARILRPLERLAYRVCRVREGDEMDWKTYAVAMLAFNFLGLLAVYALQRMQGWLPLNPQGVGAVSPDSALNTAASFATNTNWQGYGGETTMSALTQMAALTVQNFVSAATGMAVLLPLIRGFARQTTERLGNFWVDLTRSTLYVLLPLATVLSLALVSQGVIQNFKASATVAQLESGRAQILPMGPAASQVAIKQLGTNGGGFFNVNSAHPFENPTPLSNFLEVLAILLIPAALCRTFGLMVGDRRQGHALLAAMTLLFVVALAGCFWAEQSGHPAMIRLGTDTAANFEGKEVRFGIAGSTLWATATTAASNGSVNAMHDSFTPLGGLVPMALMQLGEVVFGGVGSGLYGMIVFALVAVFLAGLMVGRTPEYLGKKIGIYEMKMAVLIVLIPPALVLLGAAVAVSFPEGRAGVSNPGAHGFSQILYAFSSMGNNNGSAFAGLNANTPFTNVLGAFVMLAARYWLAIPTLAIAGALAAKKTVPTGAGTLSTHTPLFVGLLLAVVLLVGALTFLPALALGPILEHAQMQGAG
ncbi:MAG: potassium-transporting ATPase subunit KdpA [Planctomycetota bacterium]